MPPRHHYWTIILEGKPTAFRAHTQEELIPTLRQLQSRHADAVMKWFARGRLWESQQQERDDFQRRKRGSQRPDRRSIERRGRDWRPGGEHKDPRARFDKKTKRRKPSGRRPPERRSAKPWRENIRAKAAGRRRPRGEQEPERPDRQPPEPSAPPRPDYKADPAPDAPPAPEQIETKPEPPERG